MWGTVPLRVDSDDAGVNHLGVHFLKYRYNDANQMVIHFLQVLSNQPRSHITMDAFN